MESSLWLQDISNREETNWEEEFHRVLQRFNVIFGYYTEYDPSINEVVYFLDKPEGKFSNKEYKIRPIPYFGFGENGSHPDLIQELKQSFKLKSGVRKQQSRLFQHLPVQPLHKPKVELSFNSCNNCAIPCHIQNGNDYYVVFFEEIAFYQYAYFGKKEILNFYSNNEVRWKYILYLVKRALGISIENQIMDLWNYLNSLDEKIDLDYKNYGKDKIDSENESRNRIRLLIEKLIYIEGNKEIEDVILEHVEQIINVHFNDLRSRHFEEKDSIQTIVEHISKFDLNASLKIIDEVGLPILHDIFIFPMFTERESVFNVECLNPKSSVQIPVHSPFLIVLYIKTLSEITKGKDYNEDQESVKGFMLTKEIVKKFSEIPVQEDYFKKVIKKELKPAQVNSAISQVMARNTSHNLGAHVMNKLIDSMYFENFELQILRNYHTDILLDEAETKKKDTKKSNPIFEQIAIFNNYIKCRMDYLADISFGTPLMQTNKYAYKDLFKELDKVRLLLEYISGLSDFKYQIRFQKNGENLSEENDLLVAIPNDILGMQAFYNILENIIRNTAKYGKSKNDGLITFTVNFIDELKDASEEQNAILKEFITVEVYDSIDIPDEKKSNEVWYENKQSSPNDSLNINQLVDRQNQWLNKDILEDNKLRSSSLGLIEMNASAAYLRKRNISFINHPSYAIQDDETWSRKSDVGKHGTVCRHFLKALKKTDGVHNYLGYRFFLHRPAVALLVLDEGNYKANEGAIEVLGKLGIRLIKTNDFKQELIDGKVFNHEFVLHSASENMEIRIESEREKETENVLRRYKTSLPIRILGLTKKELDELVKLALDKEGLSQFQQECWSIWNSRSLKLDFRVSVFPFKQGKRSSFHNHAKGYPDQEENKHFYCDALSSEGQKKLPQFNGNLDDYTEILLDEKTAKIQLGESIYSRILVIDERIQENGKKTFINESVARLYRMTGIFIPDKKINLSENSMDDKLVTDIEEFILENLGLLKKASNKKEPLDSTYDFVLIHYGILERMYNGNKRRISDFLEIISDKANIVVTSGRGEPEELPLSVRFANLSSIVHALIEVRSKYFINYILNSSRKSSRILQ